MKGGLFRRFFDIPAFIRPAFRAGEMGQFGFAAFRADNNAGRGGFLVGPPFVPSGF
jgi:hypothetical protein